MSATVALAGCGRWGRHILRDLRTLGCEVPVVARSPESVARAREGGAARIVPTLAEVGGVDGVVVAVPVAAHAAVLDEALALGVPVFVEKPLTNDPTAAGRLAEAAPERLFVMDKWRYHPGIAALREIAASGELGAVRGLALVRDGRGDFRGDVDTIWRHLPHDLSIALEVLGAIPSARAAVAEVVDGVPMGLQGMLGDEPWVTIAHSATAPVRRREVRLCCEGGTAWLGDGYDEHINVERGAPGGGASEQSATGEPPVRRPTPGELPLLAELRAFVEHLAGGPPPRSSAAEGAENVRRIAELRALAGLQ
jgi:predicted dehydrogenase